MSTHSRPQNTLRLDEPCTFFKMADAGGDASCDGDRSSGSACDTASELEESTIKACVTIVGNYVRASRDTAEAFFRDVLPTILTAGFDYSTTRRSVDEPAEACPMLAKFLRALVDMTRHETCGIIECIPAKNSLWHDRVIAQVVAGDRRRLGAATLGVQRH